MLRGLAASLRSDREFLVEEVEYGRQPRKIASTRSDLQRKDNLIAELRRTLSFLERERERWREATGVRDPAAARSAEGPRCPCGPEG
jgi:hypothetical protein